MLKRFLSLPMWAGLIVGAAVIIVVALIFSSLNPWNPLNYFGKPDTTVDVSRAAVIKQIQSLNRLETASYTMDKVITAGTNGNVFQNLLYGDKILLIAHGTVVAGIDMAKITAADVTISGSTLSIITPAPQILAVNLDNNQTKVYDRQQGLLSKGNPNLESQARTAAEDSIRQAACTGGILNQAKQNAITRLTQNYQLVGFDHITIIVPQGNC